MPGAGVPRAKRPRLLIRSFRDPASEPDAPDPERPWGRRLLLGVVVGAALYLAFAVLTDAPALREALARLSPIHLAGALAFVTASLLVRSARWWLYRHRLGVHAGGLVGVLLGVPQGRTGLIVKTQHLHERGVRYGLAIPAVVAERATETASMGALLAAASLAAPAGLRVVGLVAAALPFVYVLLLSTPPIVEPVLARLERWHVARHRVHDVRLALGELPPLLRGRLFLAALGVGVVGVGLEASAMWLLATGMGLPLTLPQCVFAYFLGTIAGLVSALPGGIGAAEGGMLAGLIALDVPLGEAAALTLATRACTLWFSLALGIGAAVGVPRVRKAEIGSPPPPER